LKKPYLLDKTGLKKKFLNMSADGNLFDESTNSDQDNQNEQIEELLHRAKKPDAEEEESLEPLIVDSGDEGGDSATLGPVGLEDRIEPVVLEEQMQESYLTYAMSVIVSRALPDVRDGLKPVHRRIFYTMHKLNLSPGSKYMKCARVVGEVLGKYHPHGDVAVYNSLARLAQDFSMRYTLIDGQGNFGSIDGDNPAAMRYTECRLDAPAVYLLRDIEKNTVDFVDNYDGSQREPKVLPTILPNLLINGTTGIAVGMATEVPPHNLQEVAEAILYLIQNPEAEIEDLCEFIKGPDLPTGGILYGLEGIISAYKTGRGRALLQSKAETTEDRIIIHEIPYQVNKADLLVKIANLIREKRIEGIRDIRDESNKKGIRIVIETKREATPDIVLNQLFKMSDLQTYIHFNMLALVNDGRQPKVLNLKEILVEFINHRFEVVTRRTQFDLDKTEAELHILEGLKIALDYIDEVIALIRSSYDKEEAAQKLSERFSLSQKQVEAILQMRLQTLTNLDKNKIEDERAQKIELIKKLREILDNPEIKKTLVCTEIIDLKDKIKSPRRTKIVEASLTDYNKEDFIEEEDVLIQLTNSQYIKVLPLSTFRQQGRGGRGITSFNPKDEDLVKSSIVCNSHDYVYSFTNKGRVFRSRVFDLPSGSRQGRGQFVANFFELQEGETVTNLLPISKEQEKNKEGTIVFATKNGLVKQTKLENFNNIRKTGIIAIGLNGEDELLNCFLSLDHTDKIILSASNGKTVVFERDQVSTMGRSAKGVRGIRLKLGDEVISLQISNAEFTTEEVNDKLIENDKPLKTREYPSLLVITEKGYGKQTKLTDYRKTNRAAGGVKTLNMTDKTGRPVLVQILYGNEESLIVTTKNGVTIRLSLEQISQLGRNTQGVKVIRLDKKDMVVSGGVN
jgi:DNA gyrase subunit A